MKRIRSAVIVTAAAVLIAGVAVATAGPLPPRSCQQQAEEAALPLEGETFVAVCPIGHDQYWVLARGFGPEESLDVVMEDRPGRASKIIGNGYVTDKAGEARFILTGTGIGKHLTIVGTSGGLHGGSPFDGMPPPDARP